MTPVYQLTELRHQYEGRTVLDIERLDVLAGEVLAIVGPSGAGKSTLLRLLCFLERPTAGRLVFEGRAISEGARAEGAGRGGKNGTKGSGTGRRGEVEIPLTVRREVAMLFQRPILLNRSVADNVAYGLRVRGLPEEAVVRETLRQVGLEGLAGKKARKLSGGEIQRVALARALAARPAVLLLDEPTAHLDPYNVGAIETIIRELSGAGPAGGVTIVLVTHNVFQARRLAGRTGLLLNGKLVEVAETRQFFTDPRDPRTAAFARGEMIY